MGISGKFTTEEIHGKEYKTLSCYNKRDACYEPINRIEGQNERQKEQRMNLFLENETLTEKERKLFLRVSLPQKTVSTYEEQTQTTDMDN